MFIFVTLWNHWRDCRLTALLRSAVSSGPREDTLMRCLTWFMSENFEKWSRPNIAGGPAPSFSRIKYHISSWTVKKYVNKLDSHARLSLILFKTTSIHSISVFSISMSSFYSYANRNRTHAQPYTEIPTVVTAGNAANEHIENGKNVCSSPWCHTPVSVWWTFWGRSEVTLTREISPGGWQVSPRSLQVCSGPVPGSPAVEDGWGGSI